jgi:hypothetical protein
MSSILTDFAIGSIHTPRNARAAIATTLWYVAGPFAAFASGSAGGALS